MTRGREREGRGRRRPIARRTRDDTDEELRFHLEMRTEDYVRKGMSEEEARAAASARLGDLDRVRRAVSRVDEAHERVARRREWLGELRQDLRYGVRALLRAPAFTSMSVVTLALGIGATTGIFSLVHAVLLAPLPYPEPDRLVRVWETSPQGSERNVVSPGNVRDWRERARSFSALGAHSSPYSATLTGKGEPTRIVVASVQPAVLAALGVSPVVGRSFLEEDAVAADVVLLGHALWRTRYGGSEDVLGRRLVLDDTPYTVVGVMPEGLVYPSPEVDLWRPVPDAALDPDERTSHNYVVLARLAPGATVQSAQREMDGVVRQITGEHPAPMTGWGARVVPLHEDLTSNVASLFWVLLGGVAVVLLIACGNLANLLLARAVARRREIALRGALGAGRARILRQLLTESLLLAVLGGAGALVLAPFLARGLVAAAPADIPLLEGVAVDLRVLAFSAAVTLGCAILFGLAPALRLSRTDAGSALAGARGSSQDAAQTRLRSALLVAQVALSVVLLVGAGLFVRSFRAIQDTEIGFDPAGLVLMDVDLPYARYGSIAEQVALYERLLERVRALPGVLGAAGTSQPPGSTSSMTFSFAIEGRAASNPSGREDDEPLHAVTPGYFELLGRPIVRGRAFDERDHADGTPVVIINETLARKHWGDESPLGHRLAFRVGETPWREIVGVVADARLRSPDVPPEEGLYIPFAQKSWPWLTWTTVVARPAPGADAPATMAAMRSALLEVDADLPPLALGTVEGAFRENTARRTFTMTLVGGFGALALLLSVVGLYGLITYTVASQRREIGVRMALGAPAGKVVGAVFARSLGLALAGAGTGLALAAGLSRTVEGLLYEVSPTDPATYALTAAFVTTTALATATLPALRAAGTDPGRTLRAE